jgi:uncharacterized protein YoxC
MTMEFALGLIAVAFAALVGFLIAVLIQLRRAAAETQRLLAQLNTDLPPLMSDARLMIQNANALTVEARDGVEHASVLLHAMGEVGETVQEVHGLVRGQGESMLGRLATLVTGVRAAAAVVRDRLRGDRGTKEGGDGHGGM